MTSACVQRLLIAARVQWQPLSSSLLPPLSPFSLLPPSNQINNFCTPAKESVPYNTTVLKQLQGLTSGVGLSSLKLDLALKELKDHMSDLSPSSVSILIHRCKVGGHFQPDTIKTLVQAAEECAKREDFGHTQTASCVQSLACIVRSARGNFTKALEARIQKLTLDLTRSMCSKDRLVGITDKALANTMHGLGVLFKNEVDVMDRNPCLRICVERLTAEICKEHSLVAFTQQGLANIVYAYACLGWRSDFALLRLSREIINRICGFKPQEISTTVLALRKLDFRNEELILTLGVEASSPHRATVFTEQEFCNLLHGLTCLAGSLPDPQKFEVIFQRLLFQAASPLRLKKYNAQDLASILQSLVIIDQKFPQKPYLKTLATKLVARFDTLLDDREKTLVRLASVLHACAKLELRNLPFLIKVNRHILKSCHMINSAWTVTLLLWGLSSLKALTPNTFIALCERLCTLREKGAEISETNWVQLTQAIQHMERHPESVELTPELKDLLEEALNTQRT